MRIHVTKTTIEYYFTWGKKKKKQHPILMKARTRVKDSKVNTEVYYVVSTRPKLIVCAL